MQILGRNPVECALLGAFGHRPEGFHAVRVGLPTHILGNAVLDALVRTRDEVVGFRVVCIDDRIWIRHVIHEVTQCRLVGGLDDFCVNLIDRPVLGTKHRDVASHTASGVHQFLTFGIRHVLTLAAKVSSIDFSRAVKRLVGVIACLDFTNTMHHESSGRLLHADVASKFDAGNALETGEAQIDGEGPLAHRNVRPCDQRADANRELGPAVRAPVGHRLGVRNFAGFRAATLAATASALAPHGILKPHNRRFLSQEHAHQLNYKNAFVAGFARDTPSSFPPENKLTGITGVK